MIILDDVLSALDAMTESRIIDNLIGPNGLFRELSTTVLLITHASLWSFPVNTLYVEKYVTNKFTAQHLPLADQIIILGENGKIEDQGSWESLRTKANYISQVVLKERHEYSERSRKVIETKENKMWKPTSKKCNQDTQDLTRRIGDITLYGKNNPLTS